METGNGDADGFRAEGVEGDGVAFRIGVEGVLGAVWVRVVVVGGCGELKNGRDGDACNDGYGEDGDNGVVGVGRGCNGDEDGIAAGWDGGAVGPGDVGGIEGTGGTVGGGVSVTEADGTARGVSLAEEEGTARVGAGVGGVCKGLGWMGCALSWWY